MAQPITKVAQTNALDIDLYFNMVGANNTEIVHT